MMKKMTPLKSLTFLITCFCVVSFGFGQSDIIISQYIETSFGTTPKGIEIFNISGADITFSVANNLQIFQGTNGGACGNLPGTNITSGTLLADEVWVIGTTNLTTYANTNGTNLSGTVDFNFAFNGNDALQLYLGAVLQDEFGTCGNNPGSSWSGSGVTTRNNNLQILDGLCDGDGDGWTDPSERFSQIADGQIMTGFGNSPASCITCSSPTVTWTAGAWSPITGPNINTPVVLADNYDTSTASFSACSLTVNTGFTLNVLNNTFVEVQNDVTVDGNITVETQGAFVQRGNASLFTVNAGGSSLVRKTTSTLTNWYDYTYWGSPVTNETAGSALFTSDRRFEFNAANYLDILQEIGNTNVFTSGSDNIDDNGDDWQTLGSGATLTPGIGYIASHTQIGFISGNAYNYNFNGPFNNGDIPVAINYNGANTGGHWNLIGNPYSGALDFDAFYAANSTVIDGAVYLWSHRTAVSNNTSGNEDFNFSQNDYAIITAGSGSINNSDNGDGNIPNDYIPSGQGFFVVGLSNGNATFSNSMRMADGTSNSQFFKSSKEKGTSNTTANKLWINLTSDNGVFNQILVAYVDGATNGNDGMAYDAPRNLSSGIASIIYTLIDENDKKYAIQGKSTNSIDENEIVPLGFYTSINSATIYKLSIAQLEGDFLSGNHIYLKDNLLNKLHDLSASDYTFNSEVGEFNSRFEIVFNSSALSTDEVILNTNKFSIVDLKNNSVQFNTNSDLNIKTVSIFDLLGRQLYDLKGNNNSETYMLSNLKNAVYIAKIELSNGLILTKKAIKK